jgi:hypothetical protein
MGLLRILYLAMVLCMTHPVSSKAQKDASEPLYRRSSLCQIMICHSDQEYSSAIKSVYLKLPVSEHYNDHNLSVKVVETVGKLSKSGRNTENDSITAFLERNNIASRLVGKWFNRDSSTGTCNMDLIKSRGLYNADEFDRQMALLSIRGMAMLEDAGADLINNTFVVVNDVRYIDKNKTGNIISAIVQSAGVAASIAQNNSDYTQLGEGAGRIASSLDGFAVKINSFLYQLVWSDSIADIFYAQQYASCEDEVKRQTFEEARSQYKLKYIGKVESDGSRTSFMGINKNDRESMLRKALQRAIDENIAKLQHSFEVFRVKSSLVSVSPIVAYIGKKEGVTPTTLYEVLEVIEDENGKQEYKRVGIIKPVENMIWDNRYMANDEQAENSELKGTTFRKVNGKDFMVGMIIREISN